MKYQYQERAGMKIKGGNVSSVSLSGFIFFFFFLNIFIYLFLFKHNISWVPEIQFLFLVKTNKLNTSAVP